VWFSQVKRTFGENLIVLLDDPGIGLHARAQVDLLRYIAQELEPYYQVIYTTHSPFMVDAGDLGRARTVEDITAVGKDLRAALGYEITKSMASGRKALLVESPAEALYLNWFSRRLTEQGRTGLGPEWSVVPCAGGELVGAFLGLFGENRGNVAVLLDVAGGQERMAQMRDSELMRGSRILTMDKYVEGNEGGIEDLIGRRTYFGLVNMCFKLPRKYRLPVNTVSEADGGRVLEDVREYFAGCTAEMPSFNRVAVAEFLAENTKKCSRKLREIDVALDRFERVFADVNAS